MQPKGAAIRKRTQIAATNRVMFLWVAGVSVILGIAIVLAVFLIQMLLFNEKVLMTKSQTVSNLDNNNNNIKSLQEKINVLNTDQLLISAKAKPDDQAVQVILDALPSEANSLALGASLQDKLLFGINGLALDSLQVDPVVGVESLSESSTVMDTSSSDTSANSGSQSDITFSFSVNGDEAALRLALENLENSIRTIEVTSLKIESQGLTRLLTIQGRAFYEPVRDVKIKYKVIK